MELAAQDSINIRLFNIETELNFAKNPDLKEKFNKLDSLEKLLSSI